MRLWNRSHWHCRCFSMMTWPSKMICPAVLWPDLKPACSSVSSSSALVLSWLRITWNINKVVFFLSSSSILCLVKRQITLTQWLSTNFWVSTVAFFILLYYCLLVCVSTTDMGGWAVWQLHYSYVIFYLSVCLNATVFPCLFTCVCEDNSILFQNYHCVSIVSVLVFHLCQCSCLILSVYQCLCPNNSTSVSPMSLSAQKYNFLSVCQYLLLR